MIGVGIGLPFYRVFGGVDAQAQAHFDRVIADGGLVPSGLSGVNAFFNTIKTIYGTSDINTAISVGLDPQVLGYKFGAGSGTTLGQAAQKLYSCSGASGDVVQTTAASQPLLLVHSGANYWFGSGVSGNYLSSPNSAACNIRGDFEVITLGIKQFAVASGDGNIYGRLDTAQRQWIVGINNAPRTPYLTLSTDGVATTSYNATASLPAFGDEYSLKVTRNSTTGDIKFYTSLDNGANWTQLGTTLAGITGLLFNSTSTIQVGSYINGTFGNFNGKIGRITVANTIGGAPVVDFNPNQYNAATSQTQWTSSTGEVWTIQTGTATTGYKGVLVDRSITMFDGIEDFLQNPTILRGDICSQYLVYKTENALGSGISIIDSALSAWQNAFTPESSLMRLYMNGSSGSVSKPLDTLLTMYTTTNNQGVSNSIQKNNDTPTTNAYTPALSGTGLSIGKLANLAFYQKGNVQTYISAIGVNTTTIRTDMYNYIRSINNSAF